ncbi:hypothetical protein CRUP_009666 [Coryphaenoides rupestris]|nr:hypothetical protein CRUP_009666 [Coryphaenoides rupestris]
MKDILRDRVAVIWAEIPKDAPTDRQLVDQMASLSSFEQMRANVGKLLRGIDRYNPENLATLERYVETQAKENAYDLEANLAILKLYQFNPAYFQTNVTSQILLKALTNLPHTDFTLCKCMIDQTHVKFWMNKYGWTEDEEGQIFIFNQEESVKPKNIVEKIDFESVSSIMATSQ